MVNNSNYFTQTLEGIPYYSPYLVRRWIEVTEALKPVNSEVLELFGIDLEEGLSIVAAFVEEFKWECAFNQIDRNAHTDDIQYAYYVYTIGNICAYMYYIKDATETDTSEAETQVGVNVHYGKDAKEEEVNGFKAQLATLSELLNETTAPTKDNLIYLLEKTMMGTARLIRKEINLPDPELLLHNYPSSIRPQIEKLLQTKQSDLKKGKITILNGIPGSGKSFLLRSFVNEWRDWAELVYITDTEEFFNDARFFRSVLTEVERRFGVNGKTVILILEDADMYISTDAKLIQGSIVSKILNAADGIIGDALNIMFCITANESGEKVHQAFQRPGRCLHHIEFVKFPYDEAVEWAKFMDMDPELLPKGAHKVQVGFNMNVAKGEPLSLAEMYQTYRSQEIEEELL